MAVVGQTMVRTSPFNLPDGWVVEEVLRRCGGSADKYYYEPGTGRKFRSLIAVERHLAEQTENAPLSMGLAEHTENAPQPMALAEFNENVPLSMAFKLGNHIKNPSSSKKNISRDKVQSSTFTSPPVKINWVLASPGGDSWNPFIGETLVPESVKQQWAQRFMLYINNCNHDAPNSG
ncbi:unnamed protein product [Ilex paraguariensis]|uniref:MBD domain-containing protein n=1 Tax=Ilex paraguariensis TaxID=185542 RepID=A0ABC8TI41_9AQUA